MYSLRTPADVDDFCGAHPDAPDFAEQVRSLWASGAGRPEWSFLLEDGGRAVARVAYRVETTVPEGAPLGSLPPLECYLYGLWLPDEHPARAAAALFAGSLGAVGNELPELLQTRINPEVHPDHEQRRSALARVGFALFQEKQGFLWLDDGGPIPEPALRLRSLAQIGRETFVSTMARTADRTLDRNDAWYQARMTPHDWASVFLWFLDPGDEDGWLVAEDDSGGTIGFVAVSRWREEGLATISHIGVVPESRGRGHVRGLLAAAAAVTRRWALSGILADVDVENGPMMAAMHAAGYRADARPWHVWHLRGASGEIRGRAEALMASVKESSPLHASL